MRTHYITIEKDGIWLWSKKPILEYVDGTNRFILSKTPDDYVATVWSEYFTKINIEILRMLVNDAKIIDKLLSTIPSIVEIETRCLITK